MSHTQLSKRWISKETDKAIDKRDLPKPAAQFLDDLKDDLLRVYPAVDRVYLRKLGEEQVYLGVKLHAQTGVPQRLRGSEPLWHIETQYVKIELAPFQTAFWEWIVRGTPDMTGLRSATLMDVVEAVMVSTKKIWEAKVKHKVVYFRDEHGVSVKCSHRSGYWLAYSPAMGWVEFREYADLERKLIDEGFEIYDPVEDYVMSSDVKIVDVKTI